MVQGWMWLAWDVHLPEFAPSCRFGGPRRATAERLPEFANLLALNLCVSCSVGWAVRVGRQVLVAAVKRGMLEGTRRIRE